MPAYFNKGAGYKEGAWHGDMIVFNEHLSATQAIEYAGLNFDYSLHPAYSEYPIKMDDDGNILESYRIPVPRRFDLWREPIADDPEPRLVRSGIGNRYKLLQHSDLAEILDPLTDDMPVETVAVVKDWQITFITLRMPDYQVGGNEKENTRTYLHISDDRSGPGAAFWGITTVREVCWNTYMAAMSSAREMHRIPHNGDVKRELEFRRDLAVLAHNARKETMEALERMMIAALDNVGFESMIEAAFPMVKEPRELELVRAVPDGVTSKAIEATKVVAQDKQKWMDTRNDNINDLRIETRNNYMRFCDEFPYAANKVYGGFQAITQTVNHSNLYRGEDMKQYTNILIGDRGEAMDRAFNTAKGLSKN